jgi:hypothetical protein
LREATIWFKVQLATALFASMRYLTLWLALKRMEQELSKQPKKAQPEGLLRGLLAVELIYVVRMRCLNRAMMTGKGVSNTTSQLGDILLAWHDHGQAHRHLRKLGYVAPPSNKSKKSKKCGAELKAPGPKITSQQREKIVAQVLAKTVSFYQLSAQSELWRPVLDAGEDPAPVPVRGGALAGWPLPRRSALLRRRAALLSAGPGASATG